jgi:hypothetical protein
LVCALHQKRTTDSTDPGSHNPIFRVASIDADNGVLFQNSSCGGDIKLLVPIKWSQDDQGASSFPTFPFIHSFEILAAFDLIASQKFRDILPGPGFTLPIGSDVLLAFKRIAVQMPCVVSTQRGTGKHSYIMADSPLTAITEIMANSFGL